MRIRTLKGIITFLILSLVITDADGKSKDESFFKEKFFNITYVHSRMSELMVISRLAAESLERENNMQNLVSDLYNLSSEAQTTSDLMDKMINEMLVSEDKKYSEENLSAAKTNLENFAKNRSLGVKFVLIADNIIEEKGINNCVELAFARDQWVNFLSMEKFFELEEGEPLRWSPKNNLLDKEESKTEFKRCDANERKSLLFAAAMNDFIAGDYSGNSERLSIFYDESELSVGKYTICATQEQLKKLFLNRPGWTVIVFKESKISHINVISGSDFAKK